MSLIKRFELDAAMVSDRAVLAAGITNDVERFTALRSVFHECGHLAREYADPSTVVHLLVAAAVEDYHATRRHVSGLEFAGVK